MGKLRRSGCDEDSLQRFLADLSLAAQDGGPSNLTTRSSSEWDAPESQLVAQGRSHWRSDRITPDLSGSEASGLQYAGTQHKGHGRSPPRLVSNSLTSTSASCTSTREAPAGLQHQTTQLPAQQQGPEQGLTLRGVQFGPAIPFDLQTIRLQTQQRLEYFQQQVTAQTAECLADTEAPCYVACSALSGRLLSGAVPASSSQSQVDPGSSRQQHSSRRRDGAASKSRNRSSEDESQPARAGPLMCSSLLDTHVLAPQMLAGEDPLPSHAVLLSGSVPPSHSGGLAEPLRSYAGAAAASTDAQAGTLAPPAASAGGARPPEASEPLGSRADQLSEHKCNAQLAAASADAASEFSASDSGSFWERDGNDADGLRASHPDLEGFERIGRGAFGSVYRGMWRNKEVALKVIEHEDDLDGDGDSLCDDVLVSTDSVHTTRSAVAVMEAAVSSATNHPNVVKTYDYKTSSAGVAGGRATLPGNETRIVMEYCDQGSLEDAVSQGVFHLNQPASPGEGRADMACVCATLLDVASALAYLHKLHILHRDLKLKNVLLKSAETDWRGFTAKVSDFGLSKLLAEIAPVSVANLTEDNQNRDCSGTVTHMAPELLSEGANSSAADVYAFGIMMWELYTGCQVFNDLSKVQVMNGVVLHNLRPQFPKHCPTWYARLARSCWAAKPQSRPSFPQVCTKLRQAVQVYITQ